MFYQHQQECEPLCTFFHHLMKIIQTTNCEELDREIQNFKYIYIVYRDSIENDIYIYKKCYKNTKHNIYL